MGFCKSRFTSINIGISRIILPSRQQFGMITQKRVFGLIRDSFFPKTFLVPVFLDRELLTHSVSELFTAKLSSFVLPSPSEILFGRFLLWNYLFPSPAFPHVPGCSWYVKICCPALDLGLFFLWRVRPLHA